MSFHIKCFFGKHDWEVINTISERKILELMVSKSAKDRIKVINHQSREWFLGPKDGALYEQKICLRCCAIKDEPSEYMQNLIGTEIEAGFEKFQAERRQRQAKSMSESCVADKFVRI